MSTYFVVSNDMAHSIYIMTVSSQLQLSALLNWFKLVDGMFGQSNMKVYSIHARAIELNVPKLKSSYGPTVLIYLLYMAPSRVRIETTTLHVSIILLFEPIEYICDLLIQCSTAHLLPGNCQAPYLFLILNRTERRAKGPLFNYVDQILSINDHLPTSTSTSS